MTDTKLSINDFVGENGWPDEFVGGSSLTRFNTEAVIDNDILTTTDGFRSVYLNLPSEYSAGKVEIAMTVSSSERGIAFILGCGEDGRNPTEIFCNKELNDTVVLNVNCKHNNVYYCSSQTTRGDVDILRQLNTEDNRFKGGTWYDVKITLDYDKLNASDDTDTEEWITFTMTDGEGNALADETLTHLSQAVTPALKQIRVICKGETKIKDFSLKTDKAAKESAGSVSEISAAPFALASVTPAAVEEIPDMTGEEMISEVSDKVIVSTDGIKVPKYVLKSEGEYLLSDTIEDLMVQRKSRYADALYKYRIACEDKYLKKDSIAPYKFGSYAPDISNIIITNDFADRDTLIHMGYKPIYIGHSDAARSYPSDYGTYEGRGNHVIPKNDYARCRYIVGEDGSVNDVLARIFEKYPETSLMITFMDGEYRFDITDGAGTEDKPYTCITLPRDNVILRTFDYNTNFTLTDTSKIANGESLLFFDIGEYENISVFGFNYFLEDIPYSEEYYKFPKVSDKVQAVIDYVESLEQYPDINDVAKWVSEGLPAEIRENIELKETNSALEMAVLELAQMVSDLQGGSV